MLKSKSILRSKTFWTNLAATVVTVGGALAAQPWIAANPGLAAGLAAAVYVANIALRVITDQPVHF